MVASGHTSDIVLDCSKDANVNVVGVAANSVAAPHALLFPSGHTWCMGCIIQSNVVRMQGEQLGAFTVLPDEARVHYEVLLRRVG